MNFLDWIKKHIAVFTFLVTMTASILGFIGGMVVSYYKVQSKFEVIDNSFEKVNFKLDTMQKTIDREFENVYDVLHNERTRTNKMVQEWNEEKSKEL